MRTSTLLLLGLACLVAVTLTSADDTNKAKPEEMTPEARAARREEMRAKYAAMTPEQREAERQKRRAARGMDGAPRVRSMEERKATKLTPERVHNDKNEFRGTAGMFMALVAPVTPVKVSFPLDDATKLKFAAARDGLMKTVRESAKAVDIRQEHVKEDLRAKTRANQDNTLKMLVAAVQGGATVQEARMGIVIAQFEALDEATKKEALEKAKVRQDRLPEATKAKMAERLNSKNAMEKQQLDLLKTPQEKEDYVKKVYHPRQVMPHMLS